MITQEMAELFPFNSETPTQLAASSFLERMALPKDAYTRQFLVNTMVVYADYLAMMDASGSTRNDVLKIYQEDYSSPNESLCSFLNFFYHRKTGKQLDASTDITEHAVYQFLDRPFPAEKYINTMLKTYQDKVVGYKTFTSPDEKIAVRMFMDFAVEFLGYLSAEENMHIVTLFRLRDDETREQEFSRVLHYVVAAIH